MASLDFSAARREALRVIAWQALVTVLLALACWRIFGELAGSSALMGGAIGTLGSLVQASFAMRRLPDGADPQLALRGLYRGEALKVLVTLLLFVWVLRTRRVAAAELISTYAATFVVYWLALARTGASGSGPRAA